MKSVKDLILYVLLYSVQLKHAKYNHSYIEFNNYLE